MFDTIIIGGGPAGLSAAITARQRGLVVAIITNDRRFSGLYKAPEVRNYPGFPEISGAELLNELTAHALDAGAELHIGRVSVITASGGMFYVGYGNEILESKSLVLSVGVMQSSMFRGEEKLLGRGVSYCTTCDGMLFRGKRVCVFCLTPEAGAEAEYLTSIGCDVVRFGFDVKNRDISINGDERVSSVSVDGVETDCDGVFIIRKTIAPNLLLQGLSMQSGHIVANNMGETNIAGVFAAGDCIGPPYQIAKATGEGQKAALAADEYINRKSEENERN